MHFLFWFRGPSLGTEASSRKGSMMHNISFLTEMSQSCSWAVCTGWILYTVITRPFWISWSPGAHFYPASTPQTPRGTALSAMESNLTNVYFASISWSQQVCWTVLTKYSEQRRLMKLCPANFCWFLGWSGVFLVKIQHLNDANVIVISHFSFALFPFSSQDLTCTDLYNAVHDALVARAKSSSST